MIFGANKVAFMEKLKVFVTGQLGNGQGTLGGEREVFIGSSIWSALLVNMRTAD